MFTLPDLPYPADALEPVLSAELMKLHHDKHHAAYVTTVNTLLADAGRTAASMEDLVREAAAKGEKKLFNNAGQAWNHAFFWLCMTPVQAAPSGPLAQAIAGAFGDLAGLKTRFIEEGVGHFGSGWVWLVAKDGALSVISTHDAEGPLTQPGVAAVLVCDLWEHAYYLVHKNDRKAYLGQWFDKLADWGFAQTQFAAATGAGQGYAYPPPT